MRVSVVIPCFNGAEFIGEAVASVVKQDMPCEIFLVDDASTDNSLEVMQSLAVNTPNTRVIRLQSNSGPAAARNAGLRQASGEFIYFLDGDDRCGDNVFRRCIEVLDRNQWTSMVQFNVKVFNNHREELDEQDLNSWRNSHPSSVFLRRAAVELIGGFPEGPEFRTRYAGEDTTFRRCLKNWWPALVISDVYLEYRARRGSHFDLYMDTFKRGPAPVDNEYLNLINAAARVEREVAKRMTAVLCDLDEKELTPFTIRKPDGTEALPFFTFKNQASRAITRQVLAGNEYPLPPLDAESITSVLDIGANIGAAALRFRFLFPNARIDAMEPSKQPYKLLVRNLAAYPMVRLYNLGLWSKGGKGLLHLGREDSVTNSLKANLLTGRGTEEIQLLDAAMMVVGYDVIKIDTEGAEVPIMKRALGAFRAAKVVYIEYHSEQDRREIDSLLDSHILCAAKIESPHRGVLTYVHKDAFRSTAERDRLLIRSAS